MSAGPEYKAVKNFVHNSCGMGRDEIRDMIRECVKEMVKDELNRYFQSGHFIAAIKTAYGSNIRWGDNLFRDEVNKVLKEKIGDIIINQLDIKATPKERQEGGFKI